MSGCSASLFRNNVNPRVEYESERYYTFILSGEIRGLVGEKPSKRLPGWRERNRILDSSAHIIVERVRVGRGDCPLGGLRIRQLGGLLDGGVDGVGY